MPKHTDKLAQRRIAYLLLDLPGAGTTIQGFTVCKSLLEKGAQVDLLVVRKTGILAERVPAGVRVVELCPVAQRWRLTTHPAGILAVFRLARYLKSAHPAVLLSGASGSNLIALAASQLSGWGSRVVLTITSDLYHRRHDRDRGRWLSPFLVRRFYGRADKVSIGLVR